MYDYLKEYVVDDVRAKNGKQHIFYRVTEEQIAKAEKQMGFAFPPSLRQFYREIGYGFMGHNSFNINRIMFPGDIADFVGNGEIYHYVDKSLYHKDELVFFHVFGDAFLTIQYDGKEEGEILYLGKKIANCFEKFIRKMYKNPAFFD